MVGFGCGVELVAGFGGGFFFLCLLDPFGGGFWRLLDQFGGEIWCLLGLFGGWVLLVAEF